MDISAIFNPCDEGGTEMQIITIALRDGVYADVMHKGDLWYVMENADGTLAYTADGTSNELVDEAAVIRLAKNRAA